MSASRHRLTMPAHSRRVDQHTGGLPYPQIRRGLPTVIREHPRGRCRHRQPQALVDGTSLTAMRTGAASGPRPICWRAPGKYAGVIGAGNRHTQIEAICVVRPSRKSHLQPEQKRVRTACRQLKPRYSTDIAAAERRERAQGCSDYRRGDQQQDPGSLLAGHIPRRAP
jgi:ornithine cyclodeaminase/alanine dehydrogenase